MVAGRSGTQKSGFVMYWVEQMNLPTLYFSGDMSAFTASSRIASMVTGDPTEVVEEGMAQATLKQDYLDALQHSNTVFSFGSPIRFDRIESELEAYVEVFDRYPEVIVIDNLQDIEGAESEYVAQMEAMQIITELARTTGACVIVTHHASDKRGDLLAPPSRADVKNGLSEKPELTLTVALDPATLYYYVACVKQRMGPCDPTARTVCTLRCEPEVTRFHRL